MELGLFRYQNNLSALVVFVCSRDVSRKSLGRLWLTSSPFVLALSADLRVFGLSRLYVCLHP